MTDYKEIAERYKASLSDYNNPDIFSLGYQWADKKHRHVNDLCKYLTEAAGRIAELEAALKPFAEVAERYAYRMPDISDEDVVVFELKYFNAAKAALERGDE